MSGSRGPVDIIASKKTFFGLSSKKFAIQVKATTSDALRMPKKELVRLRKSTNQHDSYAVLAVRFSRERWRFWSDEEEPLLSYDESALRDLERGKSISAELTVNSNAGKLFEHVF